MQKRRVVILGSTGSIGTSALKVARDIPDRMEIVGLAAGTSVEALARQAREFNVRNVCIYDPSGAAGLAASLPGAQVETGEEGLCRLAQLPEADMVLISIVGTAGLKPALAAIEAGKDLAIASKEILVMAGQIVMEKARRAGVQVLPVDSEHNAIFQCLAGRGQEVDRLLLTASGGPFRGWTRAETRGVTPEMAVRHPNWSMGAKISVDSATMMNKGLEYIEAMHLFSVTPDDIQVVIHPQSVIHSMVELVDGTVIAQLGVPDMRIPIQYALTYPKRVPGVVPELDFAALKVLTFDVADDETFRCLAACKKAIKKGGLGPCAANGANEEAVKLFLEDKIGFLDIGRLVEAVVDSDSFGGEYTLSDVYECDRMAREFVRAHL